jgi:hypothetical protein
MMNHRDNNSNLYGFGSGGTHHGWVRRIERRAERARQFSTVDGEPVGHVQ